MRLSLLTLFIILLIAINIISLVNLVNAQPQIPLQIYGNLSKPIPDGYKIDFKIGQLDVGNGTIKDSKYGYNPLIFINKDEPQTTQKEGYVQGDTVGVYINQIYVSNISLESVGVNEISVQISEEKYNQILPPIQRGLLENETLDKNGGGCLPRYNCTEWTACSEGKQYRVCKDSLCKFKDKTEIRDCSVEEDLGDQNNVSVKLPFAKKKPIVLVTILVIFAAIIFGVAVYFFKRLIDLRRSELNTL